MRFTVQAKAFRETFSKVARAAPKVTTKPVLKSVLMRSLDGVVTLSATNLECSIVAEVGVDSCEGDGRALLPRSLTDKILACSGDATLIFEVDSDQIRVESIKCAKWKAPTEDPDLFPTFDAPDGEPGLVVDAAALRLAIARTVFATDVESTRYALGGCLLESRPGQLAMIGTDGRRLSVATADATGDGFPEPFMVAPAALLQHVAAVAKEDGPVSVWSGRTKTPQSIVFRMAGVVVSGRPVEGRFPKYADVFPKERGTVLTVSALGLKNAVLAASVVTNEKSRGVTIDCGETLATIAATCETGTAEAEVAVVRTGPESLPVCLSADYFRQALDVMDGDIEWSSFDPKSSNLFTVPNFQHVIMPLTRDR